ncbi:MAG TPA: DedA family protein [Allosphingosinicella sp.]|jgi:membrane protein DedA with SNARE-associated domain
MGDWTIRLIDQTGYVGIFLLMFLETIFPPIPSEVIMPVAGARAAQGPLSLWGVIASGTAGAMLGNLFWYALARVIGMKRFRPFIENYGRWLTMDWDDVEKSERLFGRFGGAIVSVGRMLPTIRSVISIPAGLLSMRLKTFLLWSTLGTAVWTAGLATAGWGLGMAFDDIEKILGPLSTAIILLIVVAYVWRQITWRRRHPDA